MLTFAELPEEICISGSEPLERANSAELASTTPRLGIVNALLASTTCVPDKSMRELVYSPKTNPPQRAPNPVLESVAIPASNTPFTVIVEPSVERTATPS